MLKNIVEGLIPDFFDAPFVHDPKPKNFKIGKNQIGHLAFSNKATRRLMPDNIVLLCRDPRDIALAHADSVFIGTTSGPLIDTIKSQGLTHSEVLSYFITHIVETVSCYHLAWRPHANLLLRYEQLLPQDGNWDAPMESARKILEVCGQQLPDDEIRQRLESAIQPEKSTTFNKGVIGRWETEFTAGHKELFEYSAPTLLKEMGY